MNKMARAASYTEDTSCEAVLQQHQDHNFCQLSWKLPEISFLRFYVNGMEISCQKRNILTYNGGSEYLACATPCPKHFSASSGAIRTKKGNVNMNFKRYLTFERTVSWTVDFEFMQRNHHGLTKTKIEKMSRAVISVKGYFLQYGKNCQWLTVTWGCCCEIFTEFHWNVFEIIEL